MRIGVVSDTHIPQVAGRLPDGLTRGLAGCDLIVHAGDITSAEVLTELALIAPVSAVRGNMDSPLLGLPVMRTLTCEGRSMGIMHGHGAPNGLERIVLEAFPAADVIIFGHSHRPLCRRVGGTLLFNPGTPTDPRFSSRLTYGILDVGATVEGRILDLP